MSQVGIDEVGQMRWINEVEWRSFNDENRKESFLTLHPTPSN
jgi:hypothetical protein